MLIVDDEPANLDGLQAALQNYYHVLSAQSAAEALGVAQNHKIDVVISDQRMPEMQGTELLARFAQSHPDQIRILLTGYTDVEDLIECVNQGLLYRYLVKPWQSHELIATIAQAFDKLETERQVRSQATQLQKEVEERRLTQEQLEVTLRELKEAQATLVAQEKLRALGELVSGVAHDFNNLLTPIKMYSEELLYGLDHSGELSIEDQREALETISCAVEDGSALIERLKSSYHPHLKTQSRRVFFSIPEVMRNAITLAVPRWKRRQNQTSTITQNSPFIEYLNPNQSLKMTALSYLKAHFERLEVGELPERLVVLCQTPPMLKGLGVESEIRQAIVNLICNALDASVEASPHCPLVIEVSAELIGEEIYLTVRDHGLGMTEEVQNRCREAFYSTKGEKGSGLGLHMVHQSAESHQGRLELSSELGQGTTVHLILPHVKRRYEA